MLRRRPDDTFELFLIGVSLRSAAPGRLTDTRREALRLRIMQSLGAQDRKQPAFGFVPGERWVLIPAGIGVVAAILAVAKLSDDSELRSASTGQSSAQVSTTGDSSSFVAVGDRWLSFHDDIAVGLEQGSQLDHGIDPDSRVLQFVTGRATIAVSGSPVKVVGKGFSAELKAGSVAIFESRTSDTLVRAMVGSVSLTFPGGSRMTILEGTIHAVPSAFRRDDEPAVPTADESETVPQPAGPTDVAIAPISRTQVPVENSVPAVAPSGSASDKNAAPHPPAVSVTVPSVPESFPVAEPFDSGWTQPGLTDPSSTGTEADSSQTANGSSPAGNSNGNGAANSNAGGNGNGNGPANSNAGGNGNGNSAANSNADGNGNGNGDGAANSNASGNGNGSGAANSNAGANGNGNGPANSNAGGSANGNGAANSNAGGNGNAKKKG